MNDTDKIAREPKGILKVFRKQEKRGENFAPALLVDSICQASTTTSGVHVNLFMDLENPKKTLRAAAHEQIIHETASALAAATKFIYILSRFRIFATKYRICVVGRLWQTVVVGAQTSAALKCLAELLLEASTYLAAHTTTAGVDGSAAAAVLLCTV